MKTDVIIIGGGIVGLSTAYQLLSQKKGIKVRLIEKEKSLSFHQTGNNSGVIHSGLYYKPGSLKAKNCVDGYHKMVEFCKKNEIPFELTGKIVVATNKEQIPLMNTLFERGVQNGLEGMIHLDGLNALQEYEPHVQGVAGIFVPQTGIVNYKDVALKYAEKIQELGGTIHLNETVEHIEGNEITTNQTIRNAKLIINCAGLYSDKIAKKMIDKVDYKIIPFRGEYYQLKKEKEYLVKNLIYPVPDPNFPFLGVHFTRMMKGGVEAGPNAVLAFQREGYKKSQINLSELSESLMWPGFQKVARKYWRTGMGEMYRSFSKSAFTKALQELIPEIQKEDLEAGGAGVRAQACDRKGGLVDDFLLLEDKNSIHVGNAPSPAATSSLAIGNTLAQMAIKRL